MTQGREDRFRLSSREKLVLWLNPLITVASGLGGIIVGAFLSAWMSARWDRKRWRENTLASSYTEMSLAGETEITKTKSLCVKADIEADMEQVKQMYSNNLPPLSESPFLSALKRCLLFEDEPERRRELEQLEKDYRDCRDGLLLRVKLHEQYAAGNDRWQHTEKQADARIDPEKVLVRLRALTNTVAEQRFRK